MEAAPAAEVSTGSDGAGEDGAASRPTRRGWTRAQLMRRAFDLDVLACVGCGGRLRLIALILDPRTIRAMLLSLGLPPEGADRAPPARAAPGTASAAAHASA